MPDKTATIPSMTMKIASAEGTRRFCSQKTGVAAMVAIKAASRNGTMRSSAALMPAAMIVTVAIRINALLEEPIS